VWALAVSGACSAYRSLLSYQQDGGAEFALHVAEALREGGAEARVAWRRRRRRHGRPSAVELHTAGSSKERGGGDW
jgi:hypothetical protein